jgi:hypothetical protein
MTDSNELADHGIARSPGAIVVTGTEQGDVAMECSQRRNESRRNHRPPTRR